MLEQLESHGERLIPGMIDALDDYDPEVRLLAVELLDAARPRTEAAVPALINKLADPDRLVRMAAASTLARFGLRAADAVPLLEPWLEDANEFIRLVAATTILQLDPTRTVTLLFVVKAALHSDNPVVRGLAQEFLRVRSPAWSSSIAVHLISGSKWTTRKVRVGGQWKHRRPADGAHHSLPPLFSSCNLLLA